MELHSGRFVLLVRGGVSARAVFLYPPVHHPPSHPRPLPPPAFSTLSAHKHSSGIYISLPRLAVFAQTSDSARPEGTAPVTHLLVGSRLVTWPTRGGVPGVPPGFCRGILSHISHVQGAWWTHLCKLCFYLWYLLYKDKEEPVVGTACHNVQGAA